MQTSPLTPQPPEDPQHPPSCLPGQVPTATAVSAPRAKGVGPSLALVLLAVGVAAGWLGALVWWMQPKDRAGSERSASISAQVPLDPPAESVPQLDRRRLFDERVRPLLVASIGRQAQAIEQTLELLQEQFRQVHGGVKPFAERMTGLGTQANVLWRMGEQQLGLDGRVQELIQKRFEEHFFTEAELASWIDAAVEHAEQGFIKESNLLVRDVRQITSAAGLPELRLPDYAEFARSATLEVQERAVAAARDSALGGITGFLLGALTSEVATQLALRALSGLGGQAAAGAASGGTGGLLAGPVGSGLGLIAGVSVGLAVDWYLGEQTREELERQMHAVLDGVEQALLEGDPLRPGLGPLLRAHAQRLQLAENQLLEAAIVEG